MLLPDNSNVDIEFMHFESLSPAHALPLLDFEIQNRVFFEQIIAPRARSFYSNNGIENHISVSLNQHDALAYVLCQRGSIVARANIRNITSNGVAEIGYRVAQHATGNGIGSLCVSYLIEQAKLFNLIQLLAYVMNNNPASEKILVNNGFQLTLCLPNKFQHQGRLLHGFKYHRELV